MGRASGSARIAICSLATASHHALATLALRSFGAGLPASRLVLLEVDTGAVPGPADVDRLRAEDCVPPARLAAMRRRYTGAELCFALKPFLIAALLESGHEQVHYVDADCLAFAGLEPLVDDLATADLLLTPHSLSPLPDDGRTPAALTVLRAGTFNAGYIGVRATGPGHAFARWFAAMTERQAHNSPEQGMCGDQRWLDLAPALYPGLAICRRRGANVGYWNLHERPLARDSCGVYTAAGEPLLFFHFSGFDPLHPGRLSRHQNRHALLAGESLQAVLHDYLGRLRAAGLVDAPVRVGRRRRAIGSLFGR